jgi:hypothetical protein
MRTILKTVTIAMAVAGAALVGGGTANAANVRARFDIGNVAVGFSDGYYDNDHNFHRWARSSDARRYRVAHKEQYHTWRHNDPKHPDDSMEHH